MKITELRQLDDKELVKQGNELQKKLVAMKFSHKGKQLKNYSEIKLVRGDIAKVLTILNERKLLANLEKPRKEVVSDKQEPVKTVSKKETGKKAKTAAKTVKKAKDKK